MRRRWPPSATGCAASRPRAGGLETELRAREERIAALVAILAGIERTPAPVRMLHPQGPLASARAAMLLSQAAPALEDRAARLRADLDRLSGLRALEDAAAADLTAGLAAVQAARDAVSRAISNRTDLPPRAVDAGVLRASADGLVAVAEGIAALPDAPLVTPLSLPVEGTVLRDFDAVDAAGIRRPGWVVEAEAGAQVTAPVAGTVRFAGPLLDYGLVVLLEPRADLLVVLAGLGAASVRRGQIVATGRNPGRNRARRTGN